MKLDVETKAFIREHAGDDLTRLLLSASRYPEIDIPFAVDQIGARRQIREKLPEWYANEELIFPARIAAEQCSSESTALYKQQLIGERDIVCDLTGGLGIDSYFFSKKAKEVIYIERFPAYCEAAQHNFEILNARNISVKNGNATELFCSLDKVDVFYIDPARRGEGNKRVFALSDCEPDLTILLPDLLRYATKVIAKISPMADIRQTLEMLPEITEVHVLSVKNECKELLFVIEQGNKASPEIHCLNITSQEQEYPFIFRMDNESGLIIPFASVIQSYLYEPNSSILKAGAFKSVSHQYGLEKLDVSSHLYTSNKFVEDFPGRIFKVMHVHPFTGKLCKTITRQIPQANITTRNFPLSVEELRKRTRITDGGEVYLFATTLANDQRVLIECRKV